MAEREGDKANSVGSKFTSQRRSCLRPIQIYLVSRWADPVWSGDSKTIAEATLVKSKMEPMRAPKEVGVWSRAEASPCETARPKDGDL